MLLAISATPALADVKAGVDAWSRGDFTTALKEWRPRAIAGDADAQFNMGQAYKLGRGVPADLKQAEDWYRQAAEQGHLQASDNYGLILFQNGDRQRSLPYIKASAERGEPRAQYVYGTALFNGDLVAKDWPLAYALMTRASASGLAPASASLAQMDRFIPVDQRQRGLVMARDFEQQASRPILPPIASATPPKRPSTPIIRNEPLPPSQPVPPEPQPKPPVAVAVATPRPAPRPPVMIDKPVTTPVVSGKSWRVQLGAFGDAAKARVLFQNLEGRIAGLGSLQPFLVKAGPITRLQVGPLASAAAAQKLCGSAKAAGQGCLVIAP
ncbi:MAG: SPOR domain-containing protein [Sphingomonadaceae bacterium]